MTAKDKLARQSISRMAEVFLTQDDHDEVISALTGLIESEGLRRKIAHIVRDYYAQRLRPEISKFAGLMEMKLARHDPAWGQAWKDSNPDHHLGRIRIIAEELSNAVQEKRRVGVKAADLANHCMMLADQAGELEDV